MKRDYYSIDEAAELIGYSVTDLVHLGAKGKLDIYFLPAGLVYISEKYDSGQVIERNRNEAIDEPLKISRRTLELLEAGNQDAVVSLDYDPNVARVIKRYHPTAKLDFIPYGISGMFSDPAGYAPKDRAKHDLSEILSDPAGYAQKVRDRAKEEYSDVKINEVKLVIKHDELMGFTTNLTEPKSNLNKPDQNEPHHLKLPTPKSREERLNKLREFISLLEDISKTKKIEFDKMDLPLTKPQVLVELNKRYKKNFNIKIDAFELVWKSATSAGICANPSPNTKKGEDFLKSFFC